MRNSMEIVYNVLVQRKIIVFIIQKFMKFIFDLECVKYTKAKINCIIKMFHGIVYKLVSVYTLK